MTDTCTLGEFVDHLYRVAEANTEGVPEFDNINNLRDLPYNKLRLHYLCAKTIEQLGNIMVFELD